MAKKATKPKEEKPKEKLSEFDTMLKGLLSVPPIDKNKKGPKKSN